MSWNDTDIDQLFRGATPPEAPAFQEEFWNEMEALLPVQKRRKAGFWWIGGSAALLTLIGISFVWWNSSTTNADTTKNTSAVAHAASTNVDKNNSSEQTTVETEQTAVSPTPTEPIPLNKKLNNRLNDQQVNNLQFPKREKIEDPITEITETTTIRDQKEAISNERPALVFDKLIPLEVIAKPTLTVDSPNLPQFYPDFDKPKAERFYAQLAVGIGQSYQYKVAGTSDVVHHYALGGGLYKCIDRMVLTFGVNARVDFSQNLMNSVYLGANSNHQINTKYSQLYSVELPVSIGFRFGRNTIGGTITPGFQTAFTGKETEILNEETVRSERVAGTVSNGKTLTMEIGVNYWRTLAPNWYAGVAFNVDAIRPFNPANFAGQQRFLPVNGQLTVRRTF